MSSPHILRYNAQLLLSAAFEVMTLIRPPDMVVGGLRFYRDSIFYLLSSVYLSFSSEVAERNSTKSNHMLGSECDLKCICDIWGIPFPNRRGPQNHIFSTTSQLNGKFNGLCLRGEKRYTGWAKKTGLFFESLKLQYMLT